MLVVEDDPYGLLGFDEEPFRAIRADGADHVLYLGTFSKTIAPGLRVGWVLAPHGVREKLVLASEAQILCPPTFNQLAVSRYLSTQPWLEQVKTFREIYRERRDALLDALRISLPDSCTWTVPHGRVLCLAAPCPRVWTRRRCRPARWPRGSRMCRASRSTPTATAGAILRLSYCFPPPERIREGVRRLSAVLAEELELLETFGPVRARGTAGPADGPTPELA